LSQKYLSIPPQTFFDARDSLFCPLGSHNEDIAAGSLTSAHEELLASAFLMVGFNNSKLDVHSSWLPLWLLQFDCASHNIAKKEEDWH
jgi:hypothetical protein